MTSTTPPLLSLGQCATLACLLEVTAPKVGNVHRAADFDDVTFFDFAASAVAIAPAMELAAHRGVGRTVLEAIVATRGLVSTNTNLGIVLLLAPLAAVPRNQPLTTANVGEVLRRLSSDDCRLVYEAIRLAKPGGLGKADKMDIADQPPLDLVAAMRAAEDRDLIARQYTTNFQLVLEEVLALLSAGLQAGRSLTDSIIHSHLQLLARYPDSLVLRKCGKDTAEQVSRLARQILEASEPGTEAYHAALSDFDFWLRADGHRRNPGTTADLLAAGLFAGLREGVIRPPYH